MKKFTEILSVLILTLSFAISCGGSAEAGSKPPPSNVVLEDTRDGVLRSIVRDDIRDHIYYADISNTIDNHPQALPEVVVLNTNNGKILYNIPLEAEEIYDMQLDKSKNILGVATDAGISLIHLNTLGDESILIDDHPIDVVNSVGSLTFDQYGKILFTGLGGHQLMYVYDPESHSVLHEFGVSGNSTFPTLYGGVLRTDRTGTILYAHTRGVSPVSLYKLDIKDPTNPVLLAEDVHGELGGNQGGLAISPIANLVFLGSASQPKGVIVINANNLRKIVTLGTPEQPNSPDRGFDAIDISPDGKRLFGLTWFSQASSDPAIAGIYEYNLKTFKLEKHHKITINPHQLAGNHGIAVDRRNTKAFILHGSRHRQHADMAVELIRTNSADTCSE